VVGEWEVLSEAREGVEGAMMLTRRCAVVLALTTGGEDMDLRLLTWLARRVVRSPTGLFSA
jgi:hypothetical protein